MRPKKVFSFNYECGYWSLIVSVPHYLLPFWNLFLYLFLFVVFMHLWTGVKDAVTGIRTRVIGLGSPCHDQTRPWPHLVIGGLPRILSLVNGMQFVKCSSTWMVVLYDYYCQALYNAIAAVRVLWPVAKKLPASSSWSVLLMISYFSFLLPIPYKPIVHADFILSSTVVQLYHTKNISGLWSS